MIYDLWPMNYDLWLMIYDYDYDSDYDVELWLKLWYDLEVCVCMTLVNLCYVWLYD